MQKKIYFPNLDAARFLAFLPVFFHHAFFTNSIEIHNNHIFQFIENHFKVGMLGLDFFFVLSSFLITWTILDEYSICGEFNFKKYFVRRTLRIWPLYFSIIIAIYFLSHFFFHLKLPSVSVFLFFISNFYIAHHGENFLFAVVVLWSVSVEEQFYIFWAFCLKFFKKYLTIIAFALIIISLMFRAYNLSDQKLLYFHTLSTLSNFAMGALLAYSCFDKGLVYQLFHKCSKNQSRIVYVLFLSQVVFYNYIYSIDIFQIFERLIFSLFFAFVIFDLTFGFNSIEKRGIWKVFNFFGKASFGLYCFHAIVITLFIQWVEIYKYKFTLIQTVFINPIIILAITIGIAWFSFEFFEKYFLKMKYKFYNFKAN